MRTGITLSTIALAVARHYYASRPFGEWVTVFVIQSVFSVRNDSAWVSESHPGPICSTH